MRYGIIFLFMLLSMPSWAQDDAPRIAYGGMQQLGIIVEANRVRAMPNFINGVRFSNWFAGVGIGYEVNQDFGWWGNSLVNTMPVYADVRYYFFKKKWLFAMADVGLNPIVGNEWMQDDQWNRYNKNIGFYGNIGGGVKAKFAGSTFYSFDVSYNFKQTKFRQDNYNSNLNRWTTDWNDFRQQRILLRLGLEI